jgi:hypothetical protein
LRGVAGCAQEIGARAQGGDASLPGGSGRRSRRHRRVLQTDGYELLGDTWKQFTPSVVDGSKCTARVWGNGCGGQCHNCPTQGKSLCRMHLKQTYASAGLPLGWVTGEILRRKLLEFVSARDRKEARELHLEAAVEVSRRGGRAVGGPRKLTCGLPGRNSGWWPWSLIRRSDGESVEALMDFAM